MTLRKCMYNKLVLGRKADTRSHEAVRMDPERAQPKRAYATVLMTLSAMLFLDVTTSRALAFRTEPSLAGMGGGGSLFCSSSNG